VDGAPQWHGIALSVNAVFRVENGMFTPIRMIFLPAVKPLQPLRIARNPDVTGAQIVIIRADDAYEFIAIRYVGIRHANIPSHCRWRCDHDWWRYNDGRWHDYGRRHRYGLCRGYGCSRDTDRGREKLRLGKPGDG